jgi:hypothetical protein
MLQTINWLAPQRHHWCRLLLLVASLLLLRVALAHSLPGQQGAVQLCTQHTQSPLFLLHCSCRSRALLFINNCPPGDKLTPVISIMANNCFLFSSNTSKYNCKAAVIGKSAAAHRCSDSIFCRREQFPLGVSFLWLLRSSQT